MAPGGRYRPPWFPSRSTSTYAGLVGLLVGVRALFAVVPPEVPLGSQAAALSWPAVLVIAVVGAVGLKLARRTAIPTPGSTPTESSGVPVTGTNAGRRRYGEPVLAGLGFAGAFVVLDFVVPLGIPHVPPPHAVPFYLYGAIATEILLRLAPLGTVVGSVALVRPDHRWQAGAFAATALATSLVEPVGLIGVVAPGGVAAALALGLAFAVNLVGATMCWRYGFLAAVLERAAFYFGWHVVYGGVG